MLHIAITLWKERITLLRDFPRLTLDVKRKDAMAERVTFEVRWYRYNLTEPACRKFFTEVGARLYRWYLKRRYDEDAKIYVIIN